jgi:hypothetical protein
MHPCEEFNRVICYLLKMVTGLCQLIRLFAIGKVYFTNMLNELSF